MLFNAHIFNGSIVLKNIISSAKLPVGCSFSFRQHMHNYNVLSVEAMPHVTREKNMICQNLPVFFCDSVKSFPFSLQVHQNCAWVTHLMTHS